MPLHLHSAEGSAGDSILDIKKAVARAKELGMPALALTDHGTMAMAYQFYDACVAEGVQPIIGCEVYVTNNRLIKEKADPKNKYYHLVLLAKNKTGFRNLLRITNDAHETGFYSKPRTDHNFLSDHSEGIIALSACVGGELPQKILQRGIEEEINEGVAGKTLDQEINDLIQWHKDTFDGFYLELQPGNFPDQQTVNNALIKLSEETDTPLVITTDVHYLDQDEAFYHDCHVKINYKQKLDEPMVYPDSCYYLMEAKKLLEHFNMVKKPHVRRAMKNTLAIAKKCQLDLSTNEVHMPRFDETKDEDKILEDLVFNQFEAMVPHIPDPSAYTARILHELSVIKELGFSGYFLSVHDFVDYAKKNLIAVGPGRGSVGGSLVSYLLGVTLADPVKYNLLFERFLSPHRKSMPDIDLDFSSEDRDKMFEYAQKKYGHTNTCLVSTIIRRKAKGSLDGVGRLLSMSEPDIKRIKNFVPDVFYEGDGDKNAEVDLSFALNNIRELKHCRKTYPQLFDIALKLEGIPTGFSRHPAGILISTKTLGDYIPMTRLHEETGISVTSLNLEDSEARGFVKFDFLSLSTLKVIEDTMRETKIFDYMTSKFDDKEVWKLIGSRRSAGLFQISSFTYKSRMPKLKPKSIQELSNCLALIRGPAISSGSDALYIDIVNGKSEPVHIHELYYDATKDTHGVLIFQEQLMQIAVNFGLSLEDGYKIVKAASRKRFDVLASYKKEFYERGASLNVPKAAVDEIFTLIIKSGQYLFNSAHAVSYALLCYASAHLKTHYPLQYLKNLLTNAYLRKKEDEIKEIYSDLCHYKINVLPIDINTSSWEMTQEEGNLRIGFVAVTNFGEKAYEEIKSKQPFTDFDDYTSRVTKKNCNKRATTALIFSGAFDQFEPNRSALYEKFMEFQKEVPVGHTIKVTTKQTLDRRKNNRHFEEVYMGRPA